MISESQWCFNDVRVTKNFVKNMMSESQKTLSIFHFFSQKSYEYAMLMFVCSFVCWLVGWLGCLFVCFHFGFSSWLWKEMTSLANTGSIEFKALTFLIRSKRNVAAAISWKNQAFWRTGKILIGGGNFNSLYFQQNVRLKFILSPQM